MRDVQNYPQQDNLPGRSTWALAAALIILQLFICAPTHALGLGELTVNSQLNDPLDVEITVQVSERELLGLRVQLINVETLSLTTDFELMNRIEIDLERTASGHMLHLRSQEAVDNIYINVLIELSMGGLTVASEYPIILNSRDEILVDRNAQRVYMPTTAARVRAVKRALQDTTDDPRSRIWRTKSGDTLWGIARTFQPDGTSIYQVMAAIVQANPHAFTDGNANRLNTGKILRIPKRLHELPKNDAVALIKNHNDIWKTTKSSGVPVARNPVAEKQQPTLKILTTKEDDAKQPAARQTQDIAQQVQEIIDLEKERAHARSLLTEDVDQQLSSLQEIGENVQAITKLTQAPSAPTEETEATEATEDLKADMLSTVTQTIERNANELGKAAADLVDNAFGGKMPWLTQYNTTSIALVVIAFALAMLLIALAAGKKAFEAVYRQVYSDNRRIYSGEQALSDTHNDAIGNTYSSNIDQATGYRTDKKAYDRAGIDPKKPAVDLNLPIDNALAEANAYIGYGLYDQAATLLRKTIKAHRQNFECRLKLMEVYALNKDTERYLTGAKMLKQHRDKFSLQDWQKILARGHALLPDEPLFQQPQEAVAAKLPEEPAEPAALDELDESEGLEELEILELREKPKKPQEPIILTHTPEDEGRLSDRTAYKRDRRDRRNKRDLDEPRPIVDLPPIPSIESPPQHSKSQLQTEPEGDISVGNMLDLIRMYISMREHRNARDTIEQVLQTGDEAQQAEARELLATLPSK